MRLSVFPRCKDSPEIVMLWWKWLGLEKHDKRTKHSAQQTILVCNIQFSWWRHWTPATRIFFVFPFVFKFCHPKGLNNKLEKSKNWRILTLMYEYPTAWSNFFQTRQYRKPSFHEEIHVLKKSSFICSDITLSFSAKAR